MTSGKKLQDYLQSVPVCSLVLAIHTILGSLVAQCSGDELDIEIEITRDTLREGAKNDNN